MATLKKYFELLEDRPYKMNAEMVQYEPAPAGSVLRCAACLHFFRRAVDGFSVCEIFRDSETDENGVRPDFRCQFWTIDGDIFPLQKEEEPQPAEAIPEGEDIPY